MKIVWIALLALMALPLAAQEKPKFLLLPEKPYLLVYQIDVGCEPFVMYSEGGCPRLHVDTVASFESSQSAVEFMNNDFGGGFDRMRHQLGDSWSQIPPYHCNPRLYKVVAVRIKQVKTGEYEDTEMQSVKVKRDKKEWRVVD